MKRRKVTRKRSKARAIRVILKMYQQLDSLSKHMNRPESVSIRERRLHNRIAKIAKKYRTAS